MRNCEWHKCRAEFRPARPHQRFCGPACQAAEANWRAMRGKALVPVLLTWRKSRHWSAEQKTSFERCTGQPVPTLTEIARMVDALIAEQKAGQGARKIEPEEIAQEPSAAEMRRMKALYDAEKAAGLLDSREEYETKLRDAGRGHLIGN